MEVSEETGVTGKYHVLSLSRDLLPSEIDIARRYVRGEKDLVHLLPITREHQVTNLVPVAGRNVLARLLCGDTTYTGAINYGAFGSGTTPFNTTSTQLNTEVYRKLNVGLLAESNTAYADWYIASGDVANQTFNEFAAVIDGTASANTGQPISLVLTNGWVKSGAMFVSLTLTLS